MRVAGAVPHAPRANIARGVGAHLGTDSPASFHICDFDFVSFRLGVFHSLVIEKKIPPMALCAGLDLLLTRKYVLWRFALVYERLRCEPWRPWGWGETTRGRA